MMDSFFTFLSRNLLGILLLILIILFIWYIIKDIIRFAQSNEKPKNTIQYVLEEVFAKIILEFRHLLAIGVVLIFAGVLFYTLSKVPQSSNGENGVKDILEVLQGVVASLGGLVGSIIGYYFGEFKGKSETTDNTKEPENDTSPLEPIPSKYNKKAETDDGDEEESN